MITIAEATTVINALRTIYETQGEFSTHDFIQEYCREFETEYIEWLYGCRGKGNAFQTVHGMIGNFLSENDAKLGIRKNGRSKESECVHGTMDYPMWWEFITV